MRTYDGHISLGMLMWRLGPFRSRLLPPFSGAN
jgi:hypothetical protein